MVANPYPAVSHEGPHQKGESHQMGSPQREFQEGSGSSVLQESGHEYRERNQHRKTGTDTVKEGSGGMMTPGSNRKGSEYEEEKPGKRPQEMNTNTRRPREGS